MILLALAVVLLTAGFVCAVRSPAIAMAERLDWLFDMTAAFDGPSLFAGLATGFARARPSRRNALLGLGLGLVGGFVGMRLAGPPTGLAGAVSCAFVPNLVERRRTVRRSEAIERQLGELAESAALAVRSGFGVTQALEFAANEVAEPLAGMVTGMFSQQRLGVPFDAALERFGEAVGTEDARLLVMVIGIHHRTGGNLAGALAEVATTIRERTAVRRELRALTAQGRISGAILGLLPIGFFLVLAMTSREDLAPIYHSTLGGSMILGGLLLEGLAYAWIRRLLRVQL